jgi:hypothetical protein
MTHRLAAAGIGAVVGAVSGIVLLLCFYFGSPGLLIDLAVDPPRIVSGIYSVEQDQKTRLTFAWTGPDVALRLPGLDRSVPWSAEIRARGGRQQPSDNPLLTFFVDDVKVLEHQTATEFTDIQFSVPRSDSRRRGARIVIQCSKTFIPGPQDPRPLGVMVDMVRLRPDGFALPPSHALAAAAVSSAVLGAAMGLLGFTPGLAAGAALLLAAGQSVVLARGFAIFTDFPHAMTRLSVAIAAVLVGTAMIVERLRGEKLRNIARFALTFTAMALLLKLLVLAHPNMPIGDALFQAHRFQEVLRGNFYFTSIAPGEYRFPYAPGLYVVARPFANFVSRETGDMFLLRAVTTTADAIAAVLLYVVVARVWSDRRAAAAATAFHHLLPLDFQIITIGNLTNAFAQSLAVGSLVLMSAPSLRVKRPGTIILLSSVLALAFLSHTSTFAILFVSACSIAAMFRIRGESELRSSAGAIAIATALAAAAAVLVYYSHFVDTYQTEFARISASTASGSVDVRGRGVGARLLSVPYNFRANFGTPALLLAAGGTIHLWRKGVRDRLGLSLGGWALACLAFLLLGVITPVDMRYYLASLPAVAIVSAVAFSEGWQRGGSSRALVLGLASWAAWIAVRHWLGALW